LTLASSGAGAVDAGVQRATLASDDPAVAALQIIDDWDETNRAAVNTIAGQVGVQGASGTVTALTQRVVLATDVALPAGTNNIGDVDVLSIAAGDNNIGNVDLASAIPAGTNAIGKLLPPDIDVTTHANYAKKYYTSAGAVTDGIIWSPAGGKRWHVTTLVVNVSAASTVTFEDDLAAGDSAIMKFEFAANSGVVITFDPEYPWASGEDAADLIVTTSAGNIYITAVGFEI